MEARQKYKPREGELKFLTKDEWLGIYEEGQCLQIIISVMKYMYSFFYNVTKFFLQTKSIRIRIITYYNFYIFFLGPIL